MSLIKKSDVKNHLASRHHQHIHIAPVSQPDAAGVPGTKQSPVEANGPVFAGDFTADPTTSEAMATPADEFAGRPKPKAPAAFGAKKV